MSAHLNMGDFADFQATLSNRDPNFRQLGEQPSFETERNIDMRATLRLERLLPAGAGVSLPLTIIETLIGRRSVVPRADRHLGEGDSRTAQAAQRSHDLQPDRAPHGVARRPARSVGQQPVAQHVVHDRRGSHGVSGREPEYTLGGARLSRRGNRAADDGVARLGRRRARCVAGFPPGRSDRRAAGERVPLESDRVPREHGIRARQRSPSVVPQPDGKRGGRSEREHGVQPALAKRGRVGISADARHRVSLGDPIAARLPRLPRHGG